MAGSVISTGLSLGGIGADLFGAGEAADAQKKGISNAAAQLAALQKRADEIYQPYTDAGQVGLERFQEGLDTDYGNILAGLTKDPFYQFQLQQGQDAIQGTAAARGNLRSGATLKALTEYGQGLASQQGQQAYGRQQDQMNRLWQLANLGYNADTNRVNVGQNVASQMADLSMAKGDVNAQKALVQGNALKDLFGMGQSMLSGGFF